MFFDNSRRDTHALQLHHQQVETEQRDEQHGQNSDMNGKKTRQRGAGDILTAAQEDHQRLADNRHHCDDLRAHFGGKKRQLVPGQQIT